MSEQKTESRNPSDDAAGSWMLRQAERMRASITSPDFMKDAIEKDRAQRAARAAQRAAE